jgi:hypothetical protein
MDSSPELSLREKNALVWKEYNEIRQKHHKQIAIEYLKGHIEHKITKDIKHESLTIYSIPFSKNCQR